MYDFFENFNDDKEKEKEDDGKFYFPVDKVYTVYGKELGDVKTIEVNSCGQIFIKSGR